jgi:predicted ATP-dependent serine protease|tara:strand:- start:126 stop:377 length:252 start_codon:yes stop_codon:yes gene_type:complete
MSICIDCQGPINKTSGRCDKCEEREKLIANWRSRGVPQGRVNAQLTSEVVEWLCVQAAKSKVDMATIISSIVVDAYFDELEEK